MTYHRARKNHSISILQNETDGRGETKQGDATYKKATEET